MWLLSLFLYLATPPAQRVQFILGSANEDDVEHQSHDIFCEMDELRLVGEEGDMEWKETARYTLLPPYVYLNETLLWHYCKLYIVYLGKSFVFKNY